MCAASMQCNAISFTQLSIPVTISLRPDTFITPHSLPAVDSSSDECTVTRPLCLPSHRILSNYLTTVLNSHPSNYSRPLSERKTLAHRECSFRVVWRIRAVTLEFRLHCHFISINLPLSHSAVVVDAPPLKAAFHILPVEEHWLLLHHQVASTDS